MAEINIDEPKALVLDELEELVDQDLSQEVSRTAGGHLWWCGVLNGTGPLKINFKFSISSSLKISILSPQIPAQSNGFLILLFYFISYYFITFIFLSFYYSYLSFFKSLTQKIVLFLISWS
jgi:hypothetical protein